MKCPFWNIKWGIQYEAAPFALVASEMNDLWEDNSRLLQKKLALEVLLYNASYIPVVWANIHPFYDGIGRSARLLEKWFLPSGSVKKHGATNRENIIIITVTTTAKI